MRQTRSAISSVLKQSTKLSARALSKASPTEPTGAARRDRPASGCSRSGVLTAAIGVMDERDVGAGACGCQSAILARRAPAWCACGARAASRPPCGCRRRAQSEEHQPFPAPEVGQIGDPQLVRRAGREVALHEIGPAVGQRVRSGGPPRLAAPLGALDTVGAHQPLHPAARHPLAFPEQRLPGAPIAVGLVVGGVDLADPAEQAARPRPPGPSARPAPVGSRRTPTRPGSGRSARPRSRLAVLVDDTRSLRSVWVELAREKQRRRLQDLVRPAQLVVLLAQTAGPLRAPASSTGPGAAPLSASACRTFLRKRLRVHAEVARDLRDRPLALQRKTNASLDQLIGILLRTCHGRGGSPLPRTESSKRGLRETRPGSRRWRRGSAAR